MSKGRNTLFPWSAGHCRRTLSLSSFGPGQNTLSLWSLCHCRDTLNLWLLWGHCRDTLSLWLLWGHCRDTLFLWSLGHCRHTLSIRSLGHSRNIFWLCDCGGVIVTTLQFSDRWVNTETLYLCYAGIPCLGKYWVITETLFLWLPSLCRHALCLSSLGHCQNAPSLCSFDQYKNYTFFVIGGSLPKHFVSVIFLQDQAKTLKTQ